MARSSDASESTPTPETELEAATAHPSAEETRPPMREISGVRMIAPGIDSKALSMEDLSSMGAIQPKGDLVFDRSNNFFVSADEINASTLDALIATSDFAIEQ